MELFFFRALPAAGLSFATAVAFLLFGRILLSPVRFAGCPTRAFSMLTGMLVFIAVQWFCVLFGVERYFAHVVAFMAFLAVLRVAYRAKAEKSLRKAIFPEELSFQAVFFLLCANVAVAYLYLKRIPPGQLPFYTLGNNDIFYFFNVSNFLSKPLAVVSGFPIDYGYELRNDVFGVFSLVSLLSGAYAHNVFAAPSLLAFVFSLLFLGLYDLLAPRISGGNVVLLLVVFFSSPLASFIVGHFFVGQMLSWGVLVCLLAFHDADDAGSLGLSAATSFVAYGFLLFSYPSYCLPLLALHGLVLVLPGLARSPFSAAAAREALRRLAVRLCWGLLVPFALLYGVFFSRMHYALNMMFAQAGGSQGWALPMLSLLSLGAFPVDITVASRAAGLAQIAVVCAIAAASLWAFSRPGRRTARDAGLFTLAGVYVFSLVLYAGYFLYVGESYKQWKLATFLVLPLFFVPAALFQAYMAGRLGRPASRAVLGVCLLGLCFAAVRGQDAGSGMASRYPGEASFFSEAFLSLDALNADDSVSTVCLRLKPYADTMLAMNFLWAKRVFSVAESYFSSVSPAGLAPGPGVVFVSTLQCSVEDRNVTVLDDYFYVAARGFSNPSPAIMAQRQYAFGVSPVAQSCFAPRGMKVGKDGAIAYASDAALTFRIPYAPGGYTVELCLSGFTHPPNNPVEVEISFNGAPLRTVALRDLASEDAVRLAVPAALLAEGENTLRFVSSELFSPKLFAPDSTDPARYGFVLKRIRFVENR